jgi:hypothetical protein
MNLDFNVLEVVKGIVMGKIQTEPSFMTLMFDADSVLEIFKNKPKLWYNGVMNHEGVIIDKEILIEYDPGKIYVFKNQDKILILYETSQKSNVDFLMKNIYKQIKNKKDGINK